MHAYLLSLAGLGFGCELDFAGGALGEREHSCLGAAGDGTVELEEVVASAVELVFVLSVLRE